MTVDLRRLVERRWDGTSALQWCLEASSDKELVDRLSEPIMPGKGTCHKPPCTNCSSAIEGLEAQYGAIIEDYELAHRVIVEFTIAFRVQSFLLFDSCRNLLRFS